MIKILIIISSKINYILWLSYLVRIYHYEQENYSWILENKRIRAASTSSTILFWPLVLRNSI